MAGTANVLDHYERFPEPQRGALRATLTSLLRALPGAEAKISWGMPTVALQGIALVSVEGFAAHNSLFPGPQAISRVAHLLTGYATSKGTIHFDRDLPMPIPLVRAIAKAAIHSLNARYPKADGTFLEFYDNGRLKQQGKYRDGDMHGTWSWFRRDGSVMRRGQFDRGVQRGVWQTFRRDGAVHRSTRVS